jgi:hypothetical protein
MRLSGSPSFRTVGLRVAEPARLFAPIAGELFQLQVRQVSLEGISRKFIRGFAVRTRRFSDRAVEVVLPMAAVAAYAPVGLQPLLPAPSSL